MTPLSSAHLRGLARAQQVMLASLSYPTPEGWMQAVNDEMETLLGATGAAFLLTLPTGPRVISDLAPSAMAEYFEHYVEVDVAPAMIEQLGTPFTLEEDTRASARYTDHVSGDAYNDWYRPNGMDRSISLRAYGRPEGVPTLTNKFSDELVANVLLGGSPAASGHRAGPARTMLALLQPALAAGVGSLLRSVGLQEAGRPADFSSPHVAAALEGLEAPVWLFDEAGRLLHQTAPATRLEMRLGRGDVLRAVAEQLALALLCAARARTPVPSTCSIRVNGEPVRLVGAYLDVRQCSSPAVLVRAEGLTVALPSEEEIRRRFGLTPQEARVARLRAGGASTEAIAERLSVSVHTVRRHTEHAMAKLDVHRAVEIGPRLLSASDD